MCGTREQHCEATGQSGQAHAGTWGGGKRESGERVETVEPKFTALLDLYAALRWQLKNPAVSLSFFLFF